MANARSTILALPKLAQRPLPDNGFAPAGIGLGDQAEFPGVTGFLGVLVHE